MKRTELSIVILNYNTKELTLNCIESIIKNTRDLNYEIIVVDNGSEEGFPKGNGYVLVANNKNLGFAGGNNQAGPVCNGKHVLFLNSDTLVSKDTLKKSVEYMKDNEKIGALGVKTVLPTGELDKDARRGFPTPWVALTHFSGLDRVFPHSKLFSRYWYGFSSPDKIQEIDSLQGAFILAKRDVLDKVGWFSEDYFLDGEDLDLCWKIKELGYKIVYYPEVYFTHLKKATKKKVEGKFVRQGVDSMEIFYRKHLWRKYPLALNWLVILGIRLIKVLRTIR